jgi:hypothetical protein
VRVDALALLFSNKKNVFVVVVLFSRSRVVVRDPTTMMSPRSLLGIEKIKKNRRYEEKEPTLFWSTQHDTKTQTKALKEEEERERERDNNNNNNNNTVVSRAFFPRGEEEEEDKKKDRKATSKQRQQQRCKRRRKRRRKNIYNKESTGVVVPNTLPLYV